MGDEAQQLRGRKMIMPEPHGAGAADPEVDWHARLIGTQTLGYFTAGGYFFTGEPVDYALYLCMIRVTLDDTEIEGVGIAPDEVVPFSTSGPFQDSQLERAIEYLR